MYVGNIDVVVNVDAMGSWCRVTVGIKDDLVESVMKGMCEPWTLLAVQGATPLDFVKDSLVLHHQ